MSSRARPGGMMGQPVLLHDVLAEQSKLSPATMHYVCTAVCAQTGLLGTAEISGPLLTLAR